MRTRRAPASITLVLIGSAALTGCGDETARRDIYRTGVDCQQDWGDDLPVRSGALRPAHRLLLWPELPR